MEKEHSKETLIQNDHDLSFVLEDGSLAETIYDPANKFTAFATASGEAKNIDEVKVIESIELDAHNIKPIKPNNKMLETGFIKLPSKVDYCYLPDDQIDTGHLLFTSIQKYLKEYVSLPEDFYPVIAVYVMMTWVYDRFPILPYLRVLGGFGSGKTRFLQVVGNICYKPMFINGATSVAGVYRTLDWFKGSLVFDESDFKNSDLWSDMVKVLNSGHDRSSPVVKIEIKREQYVPRAFHIFGPKIFASRERYADEALESRCITQRLHYNQTGKFPIILPPNFETLSSQLRNWLLVYRFKFYKQIVVEEIPMPEIQTPRVKQTFTAIAIVAKLIGEDVLDKVLKFGKKMDSELKSQQRSTFEVDVLITILEMINFEKGKKLHEKKLYILEIAKYFQQKFHDEHNDKEVRHYVDQEKQIMMVPNYIVSARKIGSIVARLGIDKDRDGRGFYIPGREHQKILGLKEYFGISPELITDKYEEDASDSIDHNDGLEKQGENLSTPN